MEPGEPLPLGCRLQARSPLGPEVERAPPHGASRQRRRRDGPRLLAAAILAHGGNQGESHAGHSSFPARADLCGPLL